MRATLTRFVSRFAPPSHANALPPELPIPFPLALDRQSASRTVHECSGIERAFCEGSVMIW